MGAEFMATGHYARLKAEGGQVSLLRGVDLGKDQSYILHVLTQEKLKHALFPVGDYSKNEIRAIAAQFGLAVARRPDSQDLCFLAGEDYRNFLKRNAAQMLTPGPIVNRAGDVLGEHNGLPNYTIGQRKGLGLQSLMPLYVLGKEAGSNALIVGPEAELGTRELLAVNVNWTAGSVPDGVFRAMVKSRYTAQAAAAEVTPLEDGSKARVRFDAAQRDITAGQAAVFYRDEVVLGGGIISTLQTSEEQA
jgi:tRNA-specific 2-thiouridylase